jgi:ZPR1 zinc finger protein
MCVTDIPHFKEVVIMSLLCDHCGYKSNEIKGGGAIPKFGTRIILKVQTLDDLQREVLKSDTAGIAIPELELELQEGSLDGLYTTVEGLLDKLYTRLESANPFHVGDAAKKQHLDNDGGEFSAPSISAKRYIDFLSKLLSLKEGQSLPFTMVIRDPLSNSFVGPIPADSIALALQAEKEGNNSCYTHYVDHGMEIEEYERSYEENDILGLNDMKTENYQTDLDANKDKAESCLDYYATDVPEDLPDRLRRQDHRGPDHPYAVAKAPVEGDTIVMGAGSNNFATPALGQRGKFVENMVKTVFINQDDVDPITRSILLYENDDPEFIMSETFDGKKEGMVFKLGKQGLGYYSDISLDEIISRMHS